MKRAALFTMVAVSLVGVGALVRPVELLGQTASSSVPRATPEPITPLDQLQIPKDASPRPSASDWKNATRVTLTKSPFDSRILGCRLWLVREWLKVHCARDDMGGVRQYTGSGKDVLLYASEHDWQEKRPAVVDAIFPLRQGDARIFQFFLEVDVDYNFATSSPWFVLEETWLDGASQPTVIVR
ncbi:MAG: hypothetical protein U0271_14915 [Polyangiaceae bacterium]